MEGAQLDAALDCFEQAAAIQMQRGPKESSYDRLQISIAWRKVSPIDSDGLVERSRRNMRDD